MFAVQLTCREDNWFPRSSTSAPDSNIHNSPALKANITTTAYRGKLGSKIVRRQIIWHYLTDTDVGWFGPATEQRANCEEIFTEF